MHPGNSMMGTYSHTHSHTHSQRGVKPRLWNKTTEKAKPGSTYLKSSTRKQETTRDADKHNVINCEADAC